MNLVLSDQLGNEILTTEDFSFDGGWSRMSARRAGTFQDKRERYVAQVPINKVAVTLNDLSYELMRKIENLLGQEVKLSFNSAVSTSIVLNENLARGRAEVSVLSVFADSKLTQFSSQRIGFPNVFGTNFNRFIFHDGSASTTKLLAATTGTFGTSGIIRIDVQMITPLADSNDLYLLRQASAPFTEITINDRFVLSADRMSAQMYVDLAKLDQVSPADFFLLENAAAPVRSEAVTLNVSKYNFVASVLKNRLNYSLGFDPTLIKVSPKPRGMVGEGLAAILMLQWRD